MSFDETNDSGAPKLPKGQLRCFECKRPVPMKDGAWHTTAQHSQVFLCKTCGHSAQMTATAKSQGGRGGRI